MAKSDDVDLKKKCWVFNLHTLGSCIYCNVIDIVITYNLNMTYKLIALVEFSSFFFWYTVLFY